VADAGNQPVTLALALLTAFTYVAIYTPLKRVTAIATLRGARSGRHGAAGLDGCPGRVEWQGVALFAILLCGSFPTSCIQLALSDDYARAGILMLPVVQPDGGPPWPRRCFSLWR